MAENSNIAWTHHTMNPWIGCQHVSRGCDFCYAEVQMDHRWNKVKWGPGEERKRTTEAYWRQPFQWEQKAAELGERHRVFCASLADVFDNQVPEEWRADLFDIIRQTPSLDWMLLTKRPQNMKEMLPDRWSEYDWPNVWLGVSAEDQEQADIRIPVLLDTPAAVRFVSAEPLLGPVHLEMIPQERFYPGCYNALSGEWWPALSSPDREYEHRITDLPALDLVIVGGESGPNRRPMDLDWARDLRNQCVNNEVAFFFKQESALRPGHGDVLDGKRWQEMPR